jgi:cytoskeletal protein CcmA (bactofilin family)
MWKSDKDQKPAQPAYTPAAPVATQPTKEFRPMEPLREARTDVAHIGKSVLIKGELSGSEDLYVDGEVEGNIDLHDHSLTIGPHGRVRANVRAKDVVIHGKVDGNVQGTDRVELKRSAVLVGDISTQRIVIEDGAFFKGAIDIKKDAAKPGSSAAKQEAPKAMAAAATPDYSSSISSQSSLIEEKKY